MHGDTNFHEEARLLALPANEKWLVIASLLLDNELNVGELAKRVGLSQSALSQHLARLREGKIVTTRRDAQTIYYSTTHHGVRKILSTLNELLKPVRQPMQIAGEGSKTAHRLGNLVGPDCGDVHRRADVDCSRIWVCRGNIPLVARLLCSRHGRLLLFG